MSDISENVSINHNPIKEKKVYSQERLEKLALARERAYAVRMENKKKRMQAEIDKMNQKTEPQEELPGPEVRERSPIATQEIVQEVESSPPKVVRQRKKKQPIVCVEQSSDDSDDYEDSRNVVFVKKKKKSAPISEPAFEPTPPTSPPTYEEKRNAYFMAHYPECFGLSSNRRFF